MKTTRGPLTRLFHCMESSLQFKIMLLVLMPLVLSSGCLLVLEGVDRYRNNQAQIEQQRTLLVEARQQGVRSSVELASSMIRELQATVGNTQRAQAQAVQLLSSMRFENDNYVLSMRWMARCWCSQHCLKASARICGMRGMRVGAK